MGFFLYLSENFNGIIFAIRQHFILASLPVISALIIAIPIGIVFSKFGRVFKFFENFSDISKTIPIISAFIIMIYFIGVGTFSIMTVLFIYSIYPITAKIAQGLNRLTEQKMKAIRKLGLNRWQMISLVGIPITLPYALDGIRACLIRSIALLNFAAYFGVGGLGVYIFQGIAADELTAIMIGTVFSIIIGIIVHFILKSLQNLLTARGMRKKIKQDEGEDES